MILDYDACGDVLELDGRRRLVDLLAARAGAFEEVFYQVGVEEDGARWEGFGEEWRCGVYTCCSDSGMLDVGDSGGCADDGATGDGEMHYRLVKAGGGDMAAAWR